MHAAISEHAQMEEEVEGRMENHSRAKEAVDTSILAFQIKKRKHARRDNISDW